MHCVTQMNKTYAKNPSDYTEEDKAKMIELLTELKEIKSKMNPEDSKCTLEEYQEFLDTFFTNLDREDRKGVITMKTSSKFRMMTTFIDVLSDYGPIDDDMKKCKKYCQWKAVDIFKALKEGRAPHRGGPNENLEEPSAKSAEADLENELDDMDMNDNEQPQSNNNSNKANQYQNPYGQPQAKSSDRFSNSESNDQFNNPFGNSDPFSSNTSFQGNIPPSNVHSTHSTDDIRKANSSSYNNQSINPTVRVSPSPPMQDFNQNRDAIKKTNSADQYQKVKNRESKVKDVKGEPNKKAFDIPGGIVNLTMPIRMKTIDYFKLIEGVKKINETAYRDYNKNKIALALSSVQDA